MTACAIAVPLYPTPRVAALLINGIFTAVLGSACLAAGTSQPARSFWFGFVIACSGFLLLDGLSQTRFVRSEVFTRVLVKGIDDRLPPIVHRGPAGKTQYFRSGGPFPVYFYEFGEDGKRIGHGHMELETARDRGAFTGDVSFEDLPHIDNVPSNYWQSQMLPYWLAGIFGIGGGLFAYVVRRRTTA